MQFVDDSKATNPHATIAALAGSTGGDVVLVAGGRNKGLDLGELAVLAPALRGVVAIGEAAAEVADAFAGLVPVEIATSMRDAVVAACPAGPARRPGRPVAGVRVVRLVLVLRASVATTSHARSASCVEVDG